MAKTCKSKEKHELFLETMKINETTLLPPMMTKMIILAKKA